MVSAIPAVTTAMEHVMATDSSAIAPPENDGGSGTRPDPNVRILEDLRSLVDEKQETIFDLEKKSKKTMVDLTIERQKTRQLEKDRLAFRSSCKSTAKHSVDAMNLTVCHLQTLAKAQEKSKAESLKAKDVKIKDITTQLQKNMKECKKMLTTKEDLNRTVSRQSLIISNLKGDIMSKIRQCDMLKRKNKQLTLQVTVFNRRSFELNERKMEHALQLKKIEMETESIKMRKYEQTKVLREQTNLKEHERKLKTIEFTARTRQSSKAKEIKRKQDAKLKRFQGGMDDMGVLHGELRKQNIVNGGCVPNPGTTSLTEVSFYLLLGIFYILLYSYNFFYYIRWLRY